AHESPWVMLAPLFLLAAGAIGAGYLGDHFFVGENRAECWKGAMVVMPVPASLEKAEHNPLLIDYLPLIASLGGIAVAYWCYLLRPIIPAATAMRFRAIYLFLLNKWYFDELYDRLFVRSAF